MTAEADVPSSRRRFLRGCGAVAAGALGGCVENVDETGGAPTDRQVIVKGSSTVFPVSDAIAQRYMQTNDVNVTVDSTGTGGGFKNHFCPGTAPINGASRRIRDPEIEQCSENGVEPVEFRVAGDALTVAVNPDAEWFEDTCLTFDELSLIWREGGADRWSDVRSEWPDEEIQLYGPAPTSGTYDWFNEHVVGEEHAHTGEHEQTEEDNIILKGIEDETNAMGYFGFAYYRENADRVRALSVAADEDSACGAPSLSNAADGTYPMARPLFVYVDRAALDREVVFDFLAYYLEQSASELVEEVGYVPTTEAVRDENLAKLVLERP